MIKYDIASKPIVAVIAPNPDVGEAAGEAAGVREGEGDNAGGEGVTVIGGVGVSNEVTGK